MHDDKSLLIFALLMSIYAILGTIYFIVSTVLRFLKNHKQLKENLELANDYIQDLENTNGELASGYSVMATTLEEHALLIEDLHKHMDVHCEHLSVIDEHLTQPFKIHITTTQQPANDYTGPDECNEEPYSESECPTLPAIYDTVREAINQVEALDEL